MLEKSLEKSKTPNNLNNFNLPTFFIKLGACLIILSSVLFLIAFHPLIFSELKYILLKPNRSAKIVIEQPTVTNDKKSQKHYLKPVDTDFGIVIPKIGANSSVIPNVSPYDSKIYQPALVKGVAHAEGTVFPGQIGNTFLFSHSSVNIYDANRYNAVFYLLRKLDKDDVFYLIYQKNIYKYKVFDKKITEASDINYLNANAKKNQATLMTCWPPGTTLKRLVVLGELVEQ